MNVCSIVAAALITYNIEFKPRAIRNLQGIDITVARRVAEKIQLLKYDLAEDDPRVSPAVSDYRVLFEIEGTRVIIYRIRHRKDAYK